MEPTGQGYAPYVEAPPEPPVRRSGDPRPDEPRRDDDELVEIRLDRLIGGKVRVLWRERRTLLTFVLLGFIVSVILALAWPPTYESTVTLMPPDATPAGLQALTALSGRSDALGLAAQMLGGSKSPDVLFVAILGSRAVQDRMINRFDLKKVYGASLMEEARAGLSSHTDIGIERKTSIISITVADRDPRRAQQMASAYVEELSWVVGHLSTSAAKREREFLEARLKEIKRDLDASSVEFANFASKNRALNIPEQAKAAFTAEARLQAELGAAQSELQGLEQIYTTNNVRVRALQARVGELQRQLQGTQAAGRPESLGRMIDALPQLGVQYAELYRKAQINEALYEAFIKQYEFAKVQEKKDTTPVSVLDPAEYPERKSKPRRSVVVAVGLMLSFALGAVWIFGRETWENMGPHDARKLYLQAAAQDWARRLRLDRAHQRMRGGPASGDGG